MNLRGKGTSEILSDVHNFIGKETSRAGNNLPEGPLLGNWERGTPSTISSLLSGTYFTPKQIKTFKKIYIFSIGNFSLLEYEVIRHTLNNLEFLDIRIHFIFFWLFLSLLAVPCHSSPPDNIHLGLMCGQQGDRQRPPRIFLEGSTLYVLLSAQVEERTFLPLRNITD